ncbi:hypothetical protein IF1G_03789 [Cordyceps javanica]|uniref:Uncharacterized protein n=1 Tax=Cordyceps javanica TaxID=43265 RepID=A0A545V8J9_9HYPO|nr:hypothetical protein IF1G_03789 [Cordyceps javanica]
MNNTSCKFFKLRHGHDQGAETPTLMIGSLVEWPDFVVDMLAGSVKRDGPRTGMQGQLSE